MPRKMNRVLAIGAHPDDIELGCAGTLLKHKENNNEVYLLVLTKGEASGDSKTRMKECQDSANMIKAEDLFYGNLKDTMVVEGFETINIIENILNKLSPDIIYTHSYNDTHQDHRNTSYATLSAARRCKKILMYESPTTFEEFKPRFFIDIKSVFERKKELIRIFESQSKKPWWSMGARAALASEGLAYYRGYQSGLDYAEAFELFRFVINGHESILNYP